MLFTVFLVGAPLTALAAGRWAHDSGRSTEQAELARWHPVSAVLRTAAIQRHAGPEATAWAQWTAPGGVTHTGQVPVLPGSAAGAVVTVWVDAAGRPTGPLLQPAQQEGRALLAGMVAVFILAELLWVAGLVAHGALDRRRLAAWDAEWRATGPKWSRCA